MNDVSMNDVDCIYVLDNGQIVEADNHEVLSQNENGIYNQLAQLQFHVSQ